MVILKYPSLSRKYRIKRKRHAIAPVKTIKRFSLIAFICKAIAILLFVCIVPLLIVILPLANRHIVASQKYRDTLSKWIVEFADKTKMSEKEFGHYIENFIDYLKASTGQIWNVRAGSKSGFPNRWKTAKYKSTFQAFPENSWEIKFIRFCIIGSSDHPFDVSAWLESGDNSLLPENTWKYKEIPSLPQKTISNAVCPNEFALLKDEVSTLREEISSIKSRLAI